MIPNRSLVPYSDRLNIGTYNDVAGNLTSTTYNFILPSNATANPSFESPRNASPGTTCPSFNDAPIDLLSVNFTGREQEMALIIEFLEIEHGDMPSRCALHGMHGVGKSQVLYALAKYLFKQGRYTNIFCMQATSIEELYKGFSRVLHLVSHPERYATERDARLAAAQRWFENFEGGKWLLILDNVVTETLDFLWHNLPKKNRGDGILFTTLTEDVANALTDVAGEQHGIVELRVPDVRDAANLLLKHLGNDPAAIADANTVRDVVQGVGCLPLAIAQVTAYMAKSYITLDQLLALLKGEHKIEVMCYCHIHCAVRQFTSCHS